MFFLSAEETHSKPTRVCSSKDSNNLPLSIPVSNFSGTVASVDKCRGVGDGHVTKRNASVYVDMKGTVSSMIIIKYFLWFLLCKFSKCIELLCVCKEVHIRASETGLTHIMAFPLLAFHFVLWDITTICTYILDSLSSLSYVFDWIHK